MKDHKELIFACPKCNADVPVDIPNIEYFTTSLQTQLDLSEKFCKLVTLERDAAWREIELLKAELKVLKS